MNIFISIAIIITNAIAVVLVYQFLKKVSKKDKLVFIAASIAVIYILVSFVYWISGFGIEQNVHEVAKSFITYVFVPVDVILLIPFVATKYTKLKNNEIAIDNFLKRIAIISIIALFILIIEYNYFKGMQLNIVKTLEEINATTNVISNEENNSFVNMNTTIVNSEI